MKSQLALTALLAISITANAADHEARHWWIEQKGLLNNPMIKKGILDVTLYNGWEGNAVDPTGVKDSTKALQQAIDDATEQQLVAFFPSGTYRISDTLSAMKRTRWNEKQGMWVSWDVNHIPVLLGSTKGPRPLLKLIDNAPGFNDPDHLRAAVTLWNQLDGAASMGWHEGQSPLKKGKPVDRTPPPTTVDVMNMYKASAGDSAFNEQIRGIDVDLGSGNSGAVGIAANGAQGTSLEDCKVTAYGAYAGFYNLPGAGGGETDIEVDGGRYGIVVPDASSCSPAMTGVILKNQTVAALDVFKEWTPATLVGFHITKESGPVIVVHHGNNVGGGTVALVDGSIEFTKPGANLVADNAIGESFYLRNVYIQGASEVVKSGNKPAVPCKEGITVVKEYSFANPKTSVNLLEGAVNDEEIVSVETAASVPSDLVSQHIWTRLPSFEDADTKCVKDPDIGARGDGKTDDSDALQRAIDKYEKVFLPNGKYAIGKTLVMHKDTKLFGINLGHVEIDGIRTWLPTKETTMIITDDSADGTAYLGDLNIGCNVEHLENDFFNCLTWRVGRNSIVKSVQAYQLNAWSKTMHKPTQAHSMFTITGNGGGKWYYWNSGGGYYANRNEGYRLMSIIGTHEPMSFYNYNPEHSESTPQTDIINSSNIRFLGTKVECRGQDVFHVTGSSNILMVGFGGHAEQRAGGSVYVVKDSKDVEIALAGCGQASLKGLVITEINDGNQKTIAQKEVLALFKRGTVNDQPWSTK